MEIKIDCFAILHCKNKDPEKEGIQLVLNSILGITINKRMVILETPSKENHLIFRFKNLCANGSYYELNQEINPELNTKIISTLCADFQERLF